MPSHDDVPVIVWTVAALLLVAAVLLVAGVGAAGVWIAVITVGIAVVVIVQNRSRHGLHS
jgi:hypothetical protein